MLKGKKALVTGGSRGIGRAITLAMARHGADVALIYQLNAAAADGTCADARALGVRADCWRCDVSDGGEAARTVAEVIGTMGGLDILVNNAGIVKDALLPMMKESDFRRVVETNLFGAFHMIRHASMHFIRQRSGRIINISSVAGIMGSAGQANYAAAKAGIIGLTKSVAREFASRGVTCNAIAPGFIRTDMTAAIPAERLRAIEGAIPLGRMGSPEDVADMAVFLASGMAAYVTGAVFAVDGGLGA